MPLPADGRRRSRRHTRRIGALLVAATIVPSLAGGAVAATQPTLGECRRPDTPASFHRELRLAIRLSGNLPPEWADSPYLPKIVCWQGTGFSTGFRAYGPSQTWIGVF